MKKVSFGKCVEILLISIMGGIIAMGISIAATLAIQLIIVGAVNKPGLLTMGVIAGITGIVYTLYQFINEIAAWEEEK